MERPKSTYILLVEDDVNLGYLLRENLADNGFIATIAPTGQRGVEAFRQARYDLCIFDVMLPGEDGFVVAEQLRAYSPETPFLFLTARIAEADRIHGFELGADDYVVKPFSFKELLLRIQVILRRHRQDGIAGRPPLLRLGSTELDVGERTLHSDGGRGRRLSQRETELLQILFEHAGAYVSRSIILRRLWGREDAYTARSMDVYLWRVRKIIKDDTRLEIENLYGTGYRIRLRE